MALTSSKMLAIGTKAPSFSLLDTTGQLVTFDNSSKSKGFLVMFICNHCPYVKHIADVLGKVTAEYIHKGVAVFGINSNDATKYPDDSPEKMKSEKALRKYLFPYLYDESQEVAKSYQAACTPEFFLFDENRSLVFRGQFDETRPGSGIATGRELSLAVERMLSRQQPLENQKPSVGCNIKWRD